MELKFDWDSANIEKCISGDYYIQDRNGRALNNEGKPQVGFMNKDGFLNIYFKNKCDAEKFLEKHRPLTVADLQPGEFFTVADNPGFEYLKLDKNDIINHLLIVQARTQSTTNLRVTRISPKLFPFIPKVKS